MPVFTDLLEQKRDFIAVRKQIPIREDRRLVSGNYAFKGCFNEKRISHVFLLGGEMLTGMGKCDGYEVISESSWTQANAGTAVLKSSKNDNFDTYACPRVSGCAGTHVPARSQASARALKVIITRFRAYRDCDVARHGQGVPVCVL